MARLKINHITKHRTRFAFVFGQPPVKLVSRFSRILNLEEVFMAFFTLKNGSVTADKLDSNVFQSNHLLVF